MTTAMGRSRGSHGSSLQPLPQSLPQVASTLQGKKGSWTGQILQFNRRAPKGPPPVSRLSEKVWPDRPGLVTLALRGTRDRDRKVAEGVSKYTGLIPGDGSFGSIGFYLWPPMLGAPSDILGERLHLLDGIRGSFHVYIKYDKNRSSLQIYAGDEDSVEEVLAGIRTVIQNARAESCTTAPLYVVEPPASRILSVAPILRTPVTAGQDRVVEGFRLRSTQSNSADTLTWEQTRVDAQKQNVEKHFQHICLTKNLKDLKSWMRMRVDFGIFELTRYHKSFIDGDHTYERFSSMMQDFRTAGNFRKDLGSLAEAAKVVANINKAQHLFESEDPLLSFPADTKPRHTLIIYVKPPSSDIIRLETDLDMVSPSPGGGTYQWGETLFYQTSRDKTRLDVTSCSLDKKYSWRHVIVSHDVLQELPSTLQNLVSRNSGLIRMIHDTDAHGFTYPILNIIVPPGVHIETAMIRSSLRYLIRGSSYAFEVAVYRSWDGSLLKGPPITSYFGLSFYKPGWDQDMTPSGLMNGGRNWDGELNSFFSSVDKHGMNAFHDFVAFIHRIQDVLG